MGNMTKQTERSGLNGTLGLTALFLLFLQLSLPGRQPLTRSVFSADGELVVKAPLGCAFVISGQQADEVNIGIDAVAPLRASDWNFLIREEQAVLTIDARVTSGQIVIVAPVGVRLVLESRAGKIQLHGLQGTVVVKCGCGNISLSELSGVVDIRTDSGDLFVENCQAIGQIQSQDGQIWCKNVSHDLIVKTGPDGVIVHQGQLGVNSDLTGWGMDLFLGCVDKQSYTDIKVEKGSVTVGCVLVPLALQVINSLCSIEHIAHKVDAIVSNSRGQISIDPTKQVGLHVGLKLTKALMTVVDERVQLGSVMLSLIESKSVGSFLALPFETVRQSQNGSVIQLAISSGPSGLKAELLDAVLVMPDLGRQILNRRTK